MSWTTQKEERVALALRGCDMVIFILFFIWTAGCVAVNENLSTSELFIFAIWVVGLYYISEINESKKKK